MKRLLLCIFLLFFNFQIPSVGSDIRNLKMEGMSVGDSLMYYFTDVEVKKQKALLYPKVNIQHYYSVVFFSSKFKIYDEIQFYLKSNDIKFLIYAMNGKIDFSNNIKGCYKKGNEIIAETSKLFKDAKIDDDGIKDYSKDQSGKSTIKTVSFNLKSGDLVKIECVDFSETLTEKREWQDHLRVSISTQDFRTRNTNVECILCPYWTD